MGRPYILRKGVSRLEDLVDGYMASGIVPPGPSKVYFVKYGGDNSEDGLTPDTALETLTEAISRCANWQRDYIFVINWYQNETCPIVVNKANVTIIGLPGGSLVQPGVQIAAVGDYDCFTFAAGDVAIHGLWLDAGANKSGVVFTGATHAMVRQGIYNCYFSASKYGILSSGATGVGAGHYLTIDGCHFCQTLSSGGIRIVSNGSWPRISNNFFDECPSNAIYFSSAAGLSAGQILHNRIARAADTQGNAIYMGGGTQRFMIDDNRASWGTDGDGGTNPYEDASAGRNHWMVNYKGITATEPA